MNRHYFILRMLFLIFGVMGVSLVSVGQWLIADRDDILGVVSFMEVLIDVDKKRDINPMPIIRPIYHFIVPLMALSCSFLMFLIVRKKAEVEFQSNKIFPYGREYFLCFLPFAIVLMLAHILTITLKIEGLAYGKLPFALHVVLFVSIGFPVAANNWEYFRKKLKKVKEVASLEMAEAFRDYMLSVIKLINRISLVLLISTALGSWSVLTGFEKLSEPIHSYHFITIFVGFSLSFFAILFWAVLPLVQIFEEADEVYFNTFK